MIYQFINILATFRIKPLGERWSLEIKSFNQKLNITLLTSVKWKVVQADFKAKETSWYPVCKNSVLVVFSKTFSVWKAIPWTFSVWWTNRVLLSSCIGVVTDEERDTTWNKLTSLYRGAWYTLLFVSTSCSVCRMWTMAKMKVVYIYWF